MLLDDAQPPRFPWSAAAMPPLFHFCRGHAATAGGHGRASERGGMAAALLAPEHCGSGGGPAGATAPSRQIVGVRRNIAAAASNTTSTTNARGSSVGICAGLGGGGPAGALMIV